MLQNISNSKEGHLMNDNIQQLTERFQSMDEHIQAGALHRGRAGLKALLITIACCAIAALLIVLVVHTGGFSNLFHVLAGSPVG